MRMRPGWSAAQSGGCFKFVPGFRGACHRAALRADPLAPSGIYVVAEARASLEGPLDSWYAEGPVALWRDWADDVTGYPLKGGHFFPEAAPEQTADALRRFFSGSE